MNKIACAVLLANAVNMICWTILAILFEKWWIAFFAVLFMGSLKIKDTDAEKEV